MLRCVIRRGAGSWLCEARAEEGSALDAGGLDVLGYGLGRAEVNTLGLDLVAFQTTAQRHLVPSRWKSETLSLQPVSMRAPV
jgi:hypothetical protein